MKAFISVLVLIATAFALAECFPRNTELEFVPLEGEDVASPQDGSYEVEETPFFIIPFRSFFRGFDEMIRGFANRIHGAVTSSLAPNWGKVTNATSTQKVVDGHVVTINDTTYTKEGNGSDSVFFVRVIDVKPTELSNEGGSRGESTESVERPSASVESIEGNKREDSNEIPKGQTEEVAETIDNNHSERAELLERREFHPMEAYNDLDNEVDNSIDTFNPKFISLEGDTAVNDKKKTDIDMQGKIFMVPHDVEVFDVEDGKPVYSYYPFPPNTFRQRTEKIVT